MYYFAPDTLAWQDLGRGYTDFVCWCLDGDVVGYYGEYRWPGWQEEVRGLAGDRGYLIYPPLWAHGPPVAERHRGSVPLAELYDMQVTTPDKFRLEDVEGKETL